MDFSSFSHAQQQRLAFIDFCLQYFGQMARFDCSTNYHLNEKQFPLALANNDVLTNWCYAVLASGFASALEE